MLNAPSPCKFIRSGKESKGKKEAPAVLFQDPQAPCMERLKGFEPSTSTLARLRSTTELQPRLSSGGMPPPSGGEKEYLPTLRRQAAAIGESSQAVLRLDL